jgi:hypothetical protein
VRSDRPDLNKEFSFRHRPPTILERGLG